MSTVQPLFASMTGSANRVIPYDYQFRVELNGDRTPRRQTIEVSAESSFSAVSIGYSVVPALINFTFGPVVDSSVILLTGPVSLDQITIGDLRDAAEKAFAKVPAVAGVGDARDFVLRAGIQLNPDIAGLVLDGRPMSADTAARLFRLSGLDSELQFKYALFDEGTGRAFQNEPILNTAGLGTSTGDRPFRRFSPPITFEPRSVIGLHIEPVSNFAGELFVVLHGYRILGTMGSTTDPAFLARRRPTRRTR